MITSLNRLGAVCLAALLLSPAAAAHEDEDEVVLLGPPPTSYKTKQVKAKFVALHADCDATLTATFTTPGVAAFLKKSDKSKGAVLSHGFRIKPLMPGVTILSVTVDFSDEGKEDTVLQVPLTFLPDAKPVGKAIQVGSKPLLKDLDALIGDVVDVLEGEVDALVAGTDFSTSEAAGQSVADWIDHVYLASDEGRVRAGRQAALDATNLAHAALESAGYLAEPFLPFVPDAVQRGACGERDDLDVLLQDALDKALKLLAKTTDQAEQAFEKEVAGQGAVVDIGTLSRSGIEFDVPLDLERGIEVPELLYVAAMGALTSVAGETRVRISGTVEQPGGDDLAVTLVDLSTGMSTPVDLGATNDGFRRFDIDDGLKPGGQYRIEVENINTGDTREVFVTTPSAPAVQAGD